MGRKGTIPVPFPAGGLDLTRSYQEQPPYTSPAAEDFRSDGNVEQRTRGGSRPGLEKVFQEQIGSVADRRIRMAAQVRAVPFEGATVFESNFSLPGMPPWPGWQTFQNTEPPAGQPEQVGSGPNTFGVLTANEVRNFTRTALFENFDQSKTHSVLIRIYANAVPQIFGRYRIFMSMDDATPAQGDVGSVWLGVVFTSASTFEYRLVQGTTVTAFDTVSFSPSSATFYDLKLVVDGSNVTGFLPDGTVIGPFALSSPPAGTRWGVYVKRESGDIGVPEFDPVITFRFSPTTNVVRTRNYPVFSALDDQLSPVGGGIWRESDDGGVLARVDISPYSLVQGVNLQAAERTGLLYIADAYPIIGGTGVWIDVGGGLSDGKTFRDKDGANLSAAGANTWDCVTIPLDGTAGVVQGTYPIEGFLTSVTPNDSIRLSETGVPAVPFTPLPLVGEEFTYRLERAPKVYNPVDDSFTHLAADVDTEDLYGLGTDFIKGPVPCGYRLIALFRDRLFLAGNPSVPNVWTACRQGDPGDWFTGSGELSDVGRAISSTTSEAGVIGEPITALIPFTDDYMLIGCTDSLWVLRGDPTTGIVDNVSDVLGIVDANAWCRTPEGRAYILGRDGVYMVEVGAGGPIVPDSRIKLPRELLNIDRRLFDVFLAYDVNERGIHVFLTPVDGLTNRRGWWFDYDMQAWWPVNHIPNHLPTSRVEFEADTADLSAVYWGNQDGYVRRYRFGVSTDDGNAVTSYVVVGAFRTAGDDNLTGTLNQLRIRLASTSGDVDYGLFVGQTAEDVIAEAGSASPTPQYSGSLSAGLNPDIRSRLRGNYWALRLFSSNRWALEGMVSVLRQAGRERASG